MPAVIPFIPLIAGGVSTAGSVYGAHKAASNQKKAMAADEPLRAEQLAGARQQRTQGQQLFNTGMPLLQRSGGYYNSLLSGDRSMLRQAVAPERAEVTDIYRGAEHNLDRSGVRGASRDVASGNLARDKAGKLAGLVPAARSAAAGAAANLGQAAVSGGQSGTAGAAGIYDSLLQGSLNRQQLQFQQSEANSNRFQSAGEDAGRLITDFVKAWQSRK